jgi:hypothetical protein
MTDSPDPKKSLLDNLTRALVPADRFLADHQQSTPAESPKSPDLPLVELPSCGRSHSSFAAELGKSLRPHPIFIRNGSVVCLMGGERFSEISSKSFVTWIEQYVQPFKWSGRDNPVQLASSMSDSLAATCLESSQFRAELREIRRVNPVRQPIIRANGLLELLPHGFDEASGCYTLEGVSFSEDLCLEDAALFLSELLSEFAWPEEEQKISLSKAFAMMLAVFGDLLIPLGFPRPAFIAKANREGAGKTLLVLVAVCPVHGAAKISPPSRGDELNKMLLAKMREGDPYLILDNWRGEMGDPALEAFITSSTFEGRVLGASEMKSGRKECLVFITGNNARVNPDMRRRSVVIDLEVKEATAEDRKIQKPMAEADILEKRADILAALWAVIKEWDSKGRPEGSLGHQSFPRWAKVFGGIVESMGLPSPLTRPSESPDESLRDMGILVSGLMEEILEPEIGRIFPSSELMEEARRRGLFAWILAEEKPESDAVRKERGKFAVVCTRFKNTLFGNVEFRLEDAKARTKSGGSSKQYRILKSVARQQARP